MKGARSESLALAFLKADSEGKVKNLMNKIPEMNVAKNWKPYGGGGKNWDRIGSQQTNPVGALTEKLTNSIDAVLMKLCMLPGCVIFSLASERRYGCSSCKSAGPTGRT